MSYPVLLIFLARDYLRLSVNIFPQVPDKAAQHIAWVRTIPGLNYPAI